VKKDIENFIKYIIVGSAAFSVDFMLFYCAITFIGFGYFVSGILSFMVGVFVNYLLARSYVFSYRKDINRRIEIIAVYVISLIAIMIHQAALYLLVDYYDVGVYLSKIVASIVVILWSYIARRKYVYGGNIR